MTDFWRMAPRERRTAGSTLLDEAAFAEIYAGAAFAWRYELYLDTHLIITWPLLGRTTEEQVQEGFALLMKCLRAFLAARVYPQAWIYTHERGSVCGLHTHIAICIPSQGRRAFRAWIRGWARRHAPGCAAQSVHVRATPDETPWLHWAIVSYLLKACDPDIVLVAAERSPDAGAAKKPIRLGDLVAFEFADPGRVGLRHQYGVCAGIGRAWQARGVPSCATYLLPPEWTGLPDPFRPPRDKGDGWAREPVEPFRSAYDDGVRDVRLLYPECWLRRVRGDWND